jgi:tetratricopeptide (TPR) repeat protein
MNQRSKTSQHLNTRQPARPSMANEQLANTLFNTYLPIATEAQAHRVWGELLQHPTADQLNSLQQFYNGRGQSLLQSPLHKGRHTWVNWIAGQLILMEGLGAFQQIVEEGDYTSEALHFLAFFQWECGLNEVAESTATKAIKHSGFKNVLTRRLQWAWLQDSRPHSLRILCEALLLGFAECIHVFFMLCGFNLLGVSHRLKTRVSLSVKDSLVVPDAFSPEALALDVFPAATQTSSQLSSQKSSQQNSTEEQRALLEAGNLEDALILMEADIEKNPENGDLHFEIAKVYQTQGALMKALFHLRSALNIMPHHAKSYYYMAEVLKSMDDMDGCIEAYKTAITFGVDPLWTAQVSRQLARIYEEYKGDADHALACLQLAQELEPHNINDLFSLAEVHCQHQRYEEAVRVYQNILRFQPENAEVYGFLGYLYWQSKQYADAEDAYLSAIRLNRQNPITLNNLGVLYLDIWQDYEQARHYFEQARRLDATYAMARFNLGRTFIQMREPIIARTLLEEALTLNENSQELDSGDIEALLKSL